MWICLRDVGGRFPAPRASLTSCSLCPPRVAPEACPHPARTVSPWVEEGSQVRGLQHLDPACSTVQGPCRFHGKP